ncbi:MAG TPA: flagellar hook basal-body protein [Sulfuricella sp.]|nr:flagellar hook basal-body protein [Sulfuricella sp.]
MSFQSSISGLSISAQKLDLIGNNVANASTVGFKETIGRYTDLYGAATVSGQAGMGGMSMVAVQEFSQGGINPTGNPLDMAINGKGFFQVKSSDGSLAYTRNGQFHLDKDGYVVTNNGEQLMGTSGPVKIDKTVWADFRIDASGVISGTDGKTRGPSVESPVGSGVFVPGPLIYQNIATIGLSDFRNPQGLESLGNNLWQASLASGTVISGTPAAKSMGLLQSGAVEGSTVDLNNDLVNMIITQREYQSNAQGIKTQDEMMQRLMNM